MCCKLWRLWSRSNLRSKRTMRGRSPVTWQTKTSWSRTGLRGSWSWGDSSRSWRCSTSHSRYSRISQLTAWISSRRTSLNRCSGSSRYSLYPHTHLEMMNKRSCKYLSWCDRSQSKMKVGSLQLLRNRRKNSRLHQRKFKASLYQGCKKNECNSVTMILISLRLLQNSSLVIKIWLKTSKKNLRQMSPREHRSKMRALSLIAKMNLWSSLRP